jgi:hypothetical protein
MHRINDAIVRGGKVVLSDLPFPDGQHVQVIIAETGVPVGTKVSIDEVRRRLKGGVERFDDPFEPVISPDSWDMLR